MPEVGGSEIQFADGKFVVDDIYVAPIMEATGRQPQRFSFSDAMSKAGEVMNKQHLRGIQSKVVTDHLRNHGL